MYICFFSILNIEHVQYRTRATIELNITYICQKIYKFKPIPIALVATKTLQEFLGSLNFAACASFVPGGRLPYITDTSVPLLSRERETVNISFLLKQTIQSPGCTLFKEPSARFSISSCVNRLYLRTSTFSPVEKHIAFTCIHTLLHYFYQTLIMVSIYNYTSDSIII